MRGAIFGGGKIGSVGGGSHPEVVPTQESIIEKNIFFLSKNYQ